MAKHLYGLYLGGALSIADVTLLQKEFWIIIVPTVLLVNFINNKLESN